MAAFSFACAFWQNFFNANRIFLMVSICFLKAYVHFALITNKYTYMEIMFDLIILCEECNYTILHSRGYYCVHVYVKLINRVIISDDLI